MASFSGSLQSFQGTSGFLICLQSFFKSVKELATCETSDLPSGLGQDDDVNAELLVEGACECNEGTAGGHLVSVSRNIRCCFQWLPIMYPQNAIVIILVMEHPIL